MGWGDAQPNPDLANFKESRLRETTPVRSYPANGYGLYDMTGNVMEWCLDAYNRDFYVVSPAEDPLSVNLGDVVDGRFTKVKGFRVVRGGCIWDSEGGLRVANRGHTTPRKRSGIIGFRCVRPLALQP